MGAVQQWPWPDIISRVGNLLFKKILYLHLFPYIGNLKFDVKYDFQEECSVFDYLISMDSEIKSWINCSDSEE